MLLLIFVPVKHTVLYKKGIEMKVLKSTLLIVAAIFISFSANAQVGIGTTDPHASSILELSSTTSGLLIPRVTTTQMNNISSPATGLVVYNTTESCIYFFDGANWQSTCSNTANYWGTTGNSGTDASVNYLGTSDNIDLTFRVNNQEVGRFETTTRSFHGGSGNSVSGTNTFVFGQNDTVGADYSAAFGDDNDFEADADYSVVFGGRNTVKSTASYSVTSGELNINEGVHGSAHGEHLIVNSYNMFAVGSYNDTITGNRTWVDSTNHLFVVGNGHKFCDRSNVITATWGGNVGLANSNPQTTLDIHGGFSLRPRTTLTEGTTSTVTSNNFAYNVENRSYLQITSDGSPASRSIVLSDGLQTGQIIVIECVTAGGLNGIRIVDNAGTHNINSNGTRDLYFNDVIVLMWNGTDWIEVSYTNN